MLSKEITQFNDLRCEIRAYACYLFNRNIKNYLPHVELSKVVEGLHKIQSEVGITDAFYVLNAQGEQVMDTISNNPALSGGKGDNLNDRAYFYRAIKEKKCILTDPYPTASTGELVLTAAYPLFNQAGELQYVICMDLRLEQALLLSRPAPISRLFGNFAQVVYFLLSLMLMAVAFLLFAKGILSMYHAVLGFGNLDIKEVFEATILLTLSLAIFDLVKAIFEEEVLGRSKSDVSRAVHQTMIRFLGSIIIAISIEALMLVFKFTIIEPDKIIYAVYLIGGVTMLLIGLSIYIRFTYALRDRL
ncbi:MAG: PDC sensor domain-containing protein [Wolinella sp.]